MVRTVNMPWVEKHRPTDLENVIEQDETINIIRNMVKEKNIPHLLFYGPPGTGKTTTAYALALALYGADKIKDMILELNASDERGIGTVRNKIIKFAKCTVGNKGPNFPTFKIVILDEADAMTQEAQAALRKIMETSSKITRFCIICNYKNQIIEPIESRCATFRFKNIARESLIEKLQDISLKEDLNISSDSISVISKISEGDARRAIMILQNVKYAYKNKHVTSEDIYNITSFVDKSIFKYTFAEIILKNVTDIQSIASDIIGAGYPLNYVVEYIRDQILSSHYNDNLKSKILIYLANIDMKLTLGSDEYIQLLSLLTYAKNIID